MRYWRQRYNQPPAEPVDRTPPDGDTAYWSNQCAPLLQVLKEGPRTHDELNQWRMLLRINPTMLANMLAWCGNRKLIQYIYGKWQYGWSRIKPVDSDPLQMEEKPAEASKGKERQNLVSYNQNLADAPWVLDSGTGGTTPSSIAVPIPEPKLEETSMGRVQIAEWWEVWWVKPGQTPVQHKDECGTQSAWVPPHAFPSKKSAFAYKKAQRKKYLKVFHIRRFRAIKA